MDLSIATDFAADTGDPSPALRSIADHGFTHVHWCHEWNTEHYYSESDTSQVQKWLREYGLQLLDLHASTGPSGPEGSWASQDESKRQAGMDLIRNRVEMTARLGGQTVVLHVPCGKAGQALCRSLDELQPVVRSAGIRIAIENGGDFEPFEELLSNYEAGYLGICYDAGHGNLTGDGLDHLDRMKDRLIAVHLHDNDGLKDQHHIPFTGTVDWPRLAQLVAASAYEQCLTLEVVMPKTDGSDEQAFLKQAFEAGQKLSKLVAGYHGSSSQPCTDP